MNTSSRGTGKRFSRQQQKQWVSQCLNSRLSQHEFAQRHKLCLSTLQRWIAQSRGKAWAGARPAGRTSKPAPSFIELKTPAVSRIWAAEVVRVNGSIIRLAHDVPATLLQELLSC